MDAARAKVVGAVIAGAAALALTLAPSAFADSSVQAGDARASVAAGVASLGNGAIERRWRLQAGGSVVTDALTDVHTGRQWADHRSPEFALDIGGAPSSSVSGWSLIDVTARPSAADPARPMAGAGVTLAFRYALGAQVGGAGVQLHRSFTLYPGSSVIAVASTLVNATPATLRIASYTLDQLSSSVPVSAEALTFHGGSDWRDDYRVSTMHGPGDVPVDDEGEALRLDDGSGAGWFIVTERRSGLMSRVGRDAGGRSWAGVDHARDAFDYGPLQSTPPDYNRAANPAYPVPARARVIDPGATVDLGRAYTGVYHDGPQSAAAAFVSDFSAHAMPQFARSVGLNSFHPWTHGPGTSDANLRHQVDAARALGVESFMLDDQWQGGPGGVSGDWHFNPARFPTTAGHRVPDFVDYVHAAGLRLGLWMSPVEFHPSSQTYSRHPEWACAPVGDVTAQIPDDAGLGVWDVTNPGFQAYMVGVVDRLVAAYGVTEFKFDFMAWVDCPPHDYLDYEAAFISMVRAMERRHPAVTFELDETNDQRAWPFESAALGPSWFDNGHLHGSSSQAKLLHDIWTASPWLAPSTIGFGTYDNTLTTPYSVDYLLPISLLGHITFWSDLLKLSAPAAKQTAWWLSWYKAHREDLGGVVYENTARDPIDGQVWAAFQPWRTNHGYLFAFRQAQGPATQAIVLQALDPARRYTITDVRSGATVGRASGRELRTRGLSITLPTPYSARVLAIDPWNPNETLGLRATRRCTSHRRFRIRLRAPRGQRLRSASVFVNGRRVRVLHGRRLRAPVDLRGLPRGRFTVRVTARTLSGRSVSETRRYRTCTRRAARRHGR